MLFTSFHASFIEKTLGRAEHLKINVNYGIIIVIIQKRILLSFLYSIISFLGTSVIIDAVVSLLAFYLRIVDKKLTRIGGLMGYPEFEKIFLSFCKKEFSLPNEYYCLNGMSLLNSAENIDRYILLPAGFSQENRDKYFGIDLNVLTKDLLSRYRKGRRKLANYIKNTYSSDEAVERTEEYFSIVVPRVMNNSDRRELLLELSSIAKIKIYTSVPSSIIEDDKFFNVLARIFVYSITNDESLLDLDNTPSISPRMKSVLNVLYKEGPNSLINETIDSIFDGEYVDIQHNTLLTEHNPRIIRDKAIPFSEVIQIFLDKSLSEKERVEQIKTYKPMLLTDELFLNLIKDVAHKLNAPNPSSDDSMTDEYKAQIIINKKHNEATGYDYRIKVHFFTNIYYTLDDIFYFSKSLLGYFSFIDDAHKERAKMILKYHLYKRFEYLMLNKGYSDAMHLYQELWCILSFPTLKDATVQFYDIDTEDLADYHNILDRNHQLDLLYSQDFFSDIMFCQLINKGIDTSELTDTSL